MSEIERIQLWRCPECGDQMLARGHNDSLCEGNKYEGAAHPPTSGEEVTYIPLDQVLEVIEGAAKEADDIASATRLEYPTSRAFHDGGHEYLRRLASQLKGSDDD